MTFIISGSNICARHNFLSDTIGVLPEETKAYNLIIWLICSSHSCLLLLTIIEMICFFLYNSKYHPFKMILQIEGIRRLMVNLWHNDTPGPLLTCGIRIPHEANMPCLRVRYTLIGQFMPHEAYILRHEV